MDILIIGGGAAGLAAAMAIGRMGLTALICDDGRPRNAPADHMNNFPSRDGMPPSEWRAQVHLELTKYQSISFFKGSVKSVQKAENLFIATFADGSKKHFHRIILAEGIADRLPEIAGLRERWGKYIYHCPYCHGFEVRGSRLGLLGNGKFAEHLLPMIFALSKDLVLFTNGPADFSPELIAKIKEHEIQIVETPLSAIEGGAEVRFTDGKMIERDGLFVVPILPFKLKSELGISMGCELTDMGLYKIDGMAKTTVEGVFAAGDSVTPMQSVLHAAATGQLAGAAAVSDLLHSRF